MRYTKYTTNWIVQQINCLYREIENSNSEILSQVDACAWDNIDGSPATQASTDINYNGGNVGIGLPVNTAPTAKLDVRGTGGDLFKTYTSAGKATLQAFDNGLVTNPGNGTGTGNITFGTTAAPSGINNTLYGVNAGSTITTGQRNTNIGYFAGLGTITGSRNVNIGQQSGNYNPAGNSNTVVGDGASRLISSGSGNVIVGAEAGSKHGVSSVSDAVVIGNSSNSLADGSINEIVIGANTTGNGSNTTTISNGSNTDTFLKGTLHVDGTVPGQNLLQVTTFSGATTLQANDSGSVWNNGGFSDDTKLFYGLGAGEAGTNTHVVSIGTDSSKLGGGAFSVVVGNKAGEKSYGPASCIMGYNAGSNLTFSSADIVLIGAACNTLGNGTKNVYVGSSNSLNVVGNDNVSIGNRGCFTATQLSSSVIIGSESNPLNLTGDVNEIVIGYQATGNGSNTATLGNNSITKTFLKGVINTNASYTVATLPTGIIGDIAYVTDANAPTYRGTATGGGSDYALVTFDGTNWIYI